MFGQWGGAGGGMPAGLGQQAGGGGFRNWMQNFGHRMTQSGGDEELRRKRALMYLAASMQQSGKGFGQQFGAGMGAVLGDAQHLEQTAFQRQMEKDRLELAKQEAEAAQKAREQAAADRAKAAEIEAQRWVARINAETERDKLSQQAATERASAAEAAAERRHKEYMTRLDNSASDAGAIGDYMDYATKPAEEGGAGWPADKALQRYLNRGSSNVLGNWMPGDPVNLPGAPGQDLDPDSIGAQIESDLRQQPTGGAAGNAVVPNVPDPQEQQRLREREERMKQLKQKYGMMWPAALAGGSLGRGLGMFPQQQPLPRGFGGGGGGY
jgi:hypothetical protein